MAPKTVPIPPVRAVPPITAAATACSSSPSPIDGSGEPSRKKADQFRSQDCLYSLTVAPAKGETSVRVIGAQLDYLLAPEQPAEVLKLLTDPILAS